MKKKLTGKWTVLTLAAGLLGLAIVIQTAPGEDISLFYDEGHPAQMAAVTDYEGSFFFDIEYIPLSGGDAEDNFQPDPTAARVLELVNIERAKANLTELTGLESMYAAADARALEITASFAHTRPNGATPNTVFAEHGITVKNWGEALGRGHATPERTVEGWMKSAPHRALLLGDQFKYAGIGVRSSGGRLHWAFLVGGTVTPIP